MLTPIGKTNAVEHYGSFYSSANNATEPCFAVSNHEVNVTWELSGEYELSDKLGVDGKAIVANGSGCRGSRCSFLANSRGAQAAAYPTAKRWQAMV